MFAVAATPGLAVRFLIFTLTIFKTGACFFFHFIYLKKSDNKSLQPTRFAHAELGDRLTASCAHVQPIGGGCFAIALTGSAHAPPIKAIEPTAPQS